MKLLACSLLVVAACQSATTQKRAANVSVPPAGSTSGPASAPRASPPRAAGPFVFRAGVPAVELGEYAKKYWGPNGLKVFESAASVRVGDVLDDAAPERLMEVGRYAVIEVPARQGFYLRDLGEEGFVMELEARDVSGSGKPDVVVRYRVKDDGEEADWEKWRISPVEPPEVSSFLHIIVEVWSFRGSEPERWFAHEIETWANCCGSEVSKAPPRIRNDVKVEPGRITLTRGEAWRANASSFHVRPVTDIPPPLLPWEKETQRAFRFAGHGFTRE